METTKREPELTLNPELNQIGDIPIAQSVVSSSSTTDMTDFAAGTIDESMLSPEEKDRVEQFASEINIEDVDQIVNYGLQAQTNISNFSTTILKKVKTYDLGDIGGSLKELTVALDATTEAEKKGIGRTEEEPLIQHGGPSAVFCACGRV